jgi:hypothetical protein
MKQETTSLSKQALFGFLGTPDYSTTNGPDRQLFQYKYFYAGNECDASAVVSNETVLSFDIYAQ